ncbi:glucose 1-dehydrogenase [Sphingomonas colocasiae]|uniref:Glucose 1-dehydrogenase n=1 Tax=Sphingomonas colocasiae TaxID=1848973 RepID=A0ABS7PX48_9SPHN|nr:glucose 1-dehydrogenase [Sphingomonas colocasiae]MBY8825225.1 glucose 1-dehydrogenase [Sphingomonas colocasiae]
MADRVKGKVALVTGAGSGMGAASATLLAREGAAVVVTDIRADSGEQVAADIRRAGGSAIFANHDVADEESWISALDQAHAAFGGLDIVVNNAGIGDPLGTVEALNLDEWRAMMRVNLDGVFLGVKHGIGAIRRTGRGGSIVNFSSILGMVGSPNTAAYVASKGGVRLLTKSAALHCAAQRNGIRVNAILPGWIRTPMSQGALENRGVAAGPSRAIEATPLGRLGEPEEVAYGVLFLASDEASFVTGTELAIDGGYLAQ